MLRIVLAFVLFSISAFAFAAPLVQFQCSSPVAAGQASDCAVIVTPGQKGAVFIYDGARWASIAPVGADGLIADATHSVPVRNLVAGSHTLTAKFYYTDPAVCVPGQRCSMANVTSAPATVVVQ